MVYKSRAITKDLNPCWDETFNLTVEDLNTRLDLKVYDYDWGLRDDFIGEASVDLRKLPENLAQDLLLTPVDAGHTEYLGQISLNVKLAPVKADLPLPVAHAHAHALSHSHTPSPVRGFVLAARKLKPGTWSAVVNILLVEGKELLAMDIQGTSDPYCKFRLSNDRFKSKTVYSTLNPKWNESFDLYLYDDPELEITVWDKDQRSKDDFMGRCCVNVSSLSREKSHQLWLTLEDGAGKIFVIVTVSGTTGLESPTFLSNFDSSDQTMLQIQDAYSLRNTFGQYEDVGLLVVKVYRARGLYAADLGGSSDPFTVLELDNTRLATHTEHKTGLTAYEAAIYDVTDPLLPVRGAPGGYQGARGHVQAGPGGKHLQGKPGGRGHLHLPLRYQCWWAAPGTVPSRCWISLSHRPWLLSIHRGFWHQQSGMFFW